MLRVDRSALKLVTAPFILSVLVFSLGEMQFGLDTGTFAGLQVYTPWLVKFGERSATGAYSLSSNRRSIISSIQWIGKITGTIIVEPTVHRFGYKKSMLVVVLVQVIGVVVQLAANDWIAFGSGRTLTYLVVGMVENIGPGFASEVAPAPLRGITISCLMMFLGVGGIIATAVIRGLQTVTSAHAWMIPVGIQLVPTVFIAGLIWFAVESPRWHILHNRPNAALQELDRLRPAHCARDGTNQLEVAAITEAVALERTVNSQARWIDLFRGTNLRRTMIATFLFVFQQWTGQQFFSAYANVFFISIGEAANAFTYSLVVAVLSLVLGIISAFLYDRLGRRPMLVYLTILATVFMFIVGGLGSKTNPTVPELKAVVACLIVFKLLEGISLSQACYIVGAEIGTLTLRKKTMSFATAVDVLAAFGVTFSSPYALAAIGTKFAFVFAGVGVAASVFVTLFVPELQGRSLEELDEMFEKKLWAWKFKGYQSTGVGNTINRLERNEPVEHSKMGGDHVEDIEMKDH